MAKIFLIGAGPGSREHVTPAAQKTVRIASLVIGAERSLELFREEIKGEICILKAENFDESIQRAFNFAQEGKTVAFLSTGDPTFFGLLKSLLEKSQSSTELEIVPGISSLQVAVSRLQICLENVGLFISFHGRSHNEKTKLLKALSDEKLIVIIPDPKSFQPNQIARYLIDSGVAPNTSAAVCENLTYPNERIVEGDLLMLSSEKFEPLCLMVVGTRMSRRSSGPAK